MDDWGIVSLRHFTTNELQPALYRLGLPTPSFLAEVDEESEAAESSGATFFDEVGVSDFRLRRIPDGLQVSMKLGPVPGYEPMLEVPGLGGLAVGFKTFGSLKLVVGERSRVDISGPSLILRFPERLLSHKTDGEDSPRLPAEIEITGIGHLSLDSNGELDLTAVEGGTIALTPRNLPWEIGRSRITALELDGLRLDVGGNLNQLSIHVDKTVIALSSEMEDDTGDRVKLELLNATLDCLGFTGSLGLELNPTWTGAHYSGAGAVNLFGLPIGLRHASISFEQNLPVGFELEADVALPFFEDTRPRLRLSLDDDFNILLELSSGDGAPLVLTKSGVAELQVRLLSFALENGRALVTLDGTLKPELPEGLNSPDIAIDVTGFRIGSDGSLALSSGWVIFSPELVVDFVGFKASLQKLGIGFEDGFWVSLDGGVQMADSLPSADLIGLTIVFPKTGAGNFDLGEAKLSLKGFYLDATLQEVVVFKGGGYLIDEPDRKGFGGDLLLGLPQVGLTLEASLLVGINTADPPYPFLYFALGIELPTGIPLGQSGLALFGVAGLVGINVYPSYIPSAESSWYYDWYKAPPVSGVTHSTKWTDRYLAFALGAGVTLGTADGFTVVTRALLVLALPGPLIMIEGRAAFLTGRSSLGENPPLRALLVLDLREESRSIQMFIEAQYEFVAEVLFAHGVLDVFAQLSTDPQWHIYLGEKQPVERRVRAEVLKKLLHGDAYLMFRSSGIEFGGSLGYESPRIKCGPARAYIVAAAELAGQLSMDPSQLEATLRLWGELIAKVYGVGLDLSIDASVTARVPTPWLLDLKFTFKVNLPWPLPDPKIRFRMKWEEPTKPDFPDVLTSSSVVSWIGALVPPEAYDTVPLDARLCLSFAHTVKNNTGAALIGLHGDQTFAHVISREYKFEYNLEELTLQQIDTGELVPVYGAWQKLPRMGDDDSGAQTLILLSKTAFTYSHYESDPGIIESIVENIPVEPAIHDYDEDPICIHFAEVVSTPTVMPTSFETGEGVEVTSRHTAVIIILPAGGDDSDDGDDDDRRGGLIAIPASKARESTNDPGGAGGDILIDNPPKEKGEEEASESRRREAPYGTVSVAMRWPEPVVLLRVKAEAERIFIGYEDKMRPYDPSSSPIIDHLFFVGTSVAIETVCYQDLETWRAAETDRTDRQEGERAIAGSWEAFVEHAEEFVFAPNTRYRLTASVNKTSFEENSGVNSEDDTILEFTTGGTPDNLEPYLRLPRVPAIPTRTSANDENQVCEVAAAPDAFCFVSSNGQPIGVYRADDIMLFFQRSYLRKMYELVGGEVLEMVLLTAEKTELVGRETVWRKAVDRVDTTGTKLMLNAVNTSREARGDAPIDSTLLPTDDVLVSRAVGGEAEPGWLRPGEAHTLIVRRVGANSQPLYQTKVTSSKYVSWQAMMDRLNHEIPTIATRQFGVIDIDSLTSLDDLSVLPLVGRPLPTQPAAFMIQNDGPAQSHLIMIEFPEPLWQSGFQFEWLHHGGVLSDAALLTRSDRTRFGWKVAGVPSDCTLRVSFQRPGSLADEPDEIVERLDLELQFEGISS